MAMSPSQRRKDGKFYRYYVRQDLLKDRALGTEGNGDVTNATTGNLATVCPVPAGEIAAAVTDRARQLLHAL